jgi:hypothetical protein
MIGIKIAGSQKKDKRTQRLICKDKWNSKLAGLE